MLKAPLAAFIFVVLGILQLVEAVLLSFCWSYAFNKRETAGYILTINIFVSHDEASDVILSVFRSVIRNEGKGERLPIGP